MQLDTLFFLGVLYAVLGGIALSGWLWTRDPWNLYGGVMMLIGLVLVITRPKPPGRFFLGRIRPEEKDQAKADEDDMAT